MNQIIGINDWYFLPKVAAVIVFQRERPRTIISAIFLRRSTPSNSSAASWLG
jgi:hypothetical protein